MEIKCIKCNKIPKIEILDEIQSIRFICDDAYTHFGLLTVNNFYKNFVHNNYIKDLKEFPKGADKNIFTSNYEPSVCSFNDFQREFNLLFKELQIQYKNLIDYFKKILFIKNEIFINTKYILRKDLNSDYIYYDKDIISKCKELINAIKEKIIIKEEYPKILKNEEITNSIKKFFSDNSCNLIKTDFEYYKYTFNKTSLNVKKFINFQFLNCITFEMNKKLLDLNDILNPAKFLYSYSLIF